MKTIRNLLIGVAAFATCSALAQPAFDYFDYPRVVVLEGPQTQTAVSGSITGNPVDIRGFIGRAAVLITISTNAVTQTNSITLQTSPDTTNWTSLANFAYATNTAFISTNNYYNATNLATNNILYPGVVIYPNASLAGFATPYPQYAQFTNSGAVTVANAQGAYLIGFEIQDQPRYLRALVSQTGVASTNTASSVILYGAKIRD